MDKQTQSNSPVSEPISDQATEVLKQAVLAHWEDPGAEAERLYQQALTLDPALVTAWIRYAVLLAQQSRLDEAEAKLAQALSLNPELAGSQLAQVRRQYPNDKALLPLTAFLEKHHASATSEATQAIFDATEVIPIARPATAEVEQDLLQQAQIEASRGHLGRAEHLFRQAIEAQAKEVTFYGDYARFLMQQQRYQAAIEQLETARQFDAMNPTINQMLSEARATLEQRQEATRNITARVQQAFQEVEQLQTKEDYESAIATLIEIQKLLPGDEEIQEHLNELKEERGRFLTITSWLDDARQQALTGHLPAAQAQLERARALKPASPLVSRMSVELENINHAWQKLNQARGLIGTDLGTALKLVEEARKLAPDLEEASELRRKLEAKYQAKRQKELEAEFNGLLEAGKLAEAKKILEQIPNNSALRQRLAQAETARQRQQEAEELLVKAREATGRGRWDEALRQVEAALVKAPALAEAEQLKAEIGRDQTLVHNLLVEVERLVTAGDYEPGLVKLAEACQQFPANKELQTRQVAIRSEFDRAQELEVQLEALLDEGRKADQRGDLNQAMKVYQAALKLRPDHPKARQLLDQLQERIAQANELYRKAQTLTEARQYSEAEELLKQALELTPQAEKISLTLTQCQHARQAAEYLRQAKEQEAAQKYEQAKILWEKALKIHPDDSLDQEYQAFLERYEAYIKQPPPGEKPLETIVCPNCGHHGRAGAKFCPACGKPYELPQSTCPHCSKPIRAEAKFCPACGKSPELTEQRCPQCGALVRSGAKFCQDCGQSIQSQPDEGRCELCGETLRPEARFCPACGAARERT